MAKPRERSEARGWRQKNLSEDTYIMANVGIGRNGFGLEVERIAHILRLPREESEALMDDAHQVYLYSKATRGNIEVEPSVAE